MEILRVDLSTYGLIRHCFRIFQLLTSCILWCFWHCESGISANMRNAPKFWLNYLRDLLSDVFLLIAMFLWFLQGLATAVDTESRFLWEVPDNWTLEDAATVPVVYCTAYYALVTRGRIQKGERVLIHSGSGGVGQVRVPVWASICHFLNGRVGREKAGNNFHFFKIRVV